MAEGNGNVKWWQLVTISMSFFVLLGTISVFAAKEIIVNDRLRVSEDKGLQCEIDKLRSEFLYKVSSIDCSLATLTAYIHPENSRK